MDNLTQLNDDQLIQLGRQTQDALTKLILQYDTNKRKDAIINKELFTFEYTDKGKREWVQATIGVITDPLLFHEENSFIHSWISTKVHLKLTEQMCNCFLQMIDILEENKIPFDVGTLLIKTVENNFTLLAEQLNNVKEIK
jgi:hypothetical protein